MSRICKIIKLLPPLARSAEEEPESFAALRFATTFSRQHVQVADEAHALAFLIHIPPNSDNNAQRAIACANVLDAVR